MACGAPGGNGAMFRARTEADAKAHAREIASRGRRRRRSRREMTIVIGFVALVLAGWGVAEALGVV